MGKRIKGAAAAVLCAVAVLTGCGRKEEAEVQKEPPRESLMVWSYYETDEQQKSLDKLIDDFNYSQKAYEAAWEYVPMTEFTKRLAIGVTEEALPDIVIIDNPDMKNYVNLGLFEDITREVGQWERQDGYYPQVWESVMYEGRCYGLPFCCNNLALIYNRGMLEEAGVRPPGNWEEFMKAAKALSHDQTYGFIMSAVEGEQAAFQVLPWILSEGEEPGEIGGEKTAAALEKIREMVENGYMDRNCINWSQNDIARKFAAGEAAMMENGPWVLPMVREAGIEYGIVELPFALDSRSIIGGENLGVIKGKNVQGALAFLKYYSQDGVMREICAMSSVLPPKEGLGEGQGPDMEIFSRQMDHAVSRASFGGWEHKSKALSDAVYGVITEEKTAGQAAREIQERCTELR